MKPKGDPLGNAFSDFLTSQGHRVVEITPKTIADRCVFCQKIKEGSVTFEREDVVSFEPLNPVTKGHLLVVPITHKEDFAENEFTTARVMEVASGMAKKLGGEFNLITSKGKNATQSIKHLHVHLVPRRENDGLLLPWTNLHSTPPVGGGWEEKHKEIKD